MTKSGNKDVFINAPFDSVYLPTLRPIVFSVVRSGYLVRCALEVDNSAENRLDRICKIIDQCKFAIHDISRTEVSGNPPLPRFNMPLELGLFLGAKTFGDTNQRKKACIIMDKKQYRYQRFISDLSGVDIHAHEGKPKNAVLAVCGWLRSHAGGVAPGGGSHIWAEYQSFNREIKKYCALGKIEVSELTFQDYHRLMADCVSTL